MNGIFTAKKKDGSLYYRASITFRNKHISLGSKDTEPRARRLYNEASRILYSDLSIEDYIITSALAFSTWIILINFRDNGVYFRNPIYLKKNLFLYYISENIVFKFDKDDLFYYSEHAIQCRGGHYFCEDYGSQINLKSRYGIRPFAVENRDYRFLNGDNTDFRYENIEIINPYHGVERDDRKFPLRYKAHIHIRSNYSLGSYPNAETAAIAVNKAIDMLSKTDLKKKGMQSNFIDNLTASHYADIYSSIELPKRFLELINDHLLE
ncbi:hypothetical protein QYZ88_001755 [Lachnospiraceae bacterium C1.1]|nr:hypothetical protein [Lachnospiraceae bacterium C1.1]